MYGIRSTSLLPKSYSSACVSFYPVNKPITIAIYIPIHQSGGCDEWPVFIFGFLINASFLLLFLDFYLKAYYTPKKVVQRIPMQKRKDQ
jgi:hypothetical protein